MNAVADEKPVAAPVAPRRRILQISGAMYFGGAERVIAHLASGLDKSRFEVAVCCTRGIGPLGEQLREQGIEVTLVQAPSRWARRFDPLYMQRFIRQFRPDVIHTHGLPALSAVGPLSYLGLLPPWVHTFHYGNYPYAEKRYMWLERVLSRRATRLVAVADAQRDAVIRHHGLRPDHVGTVYNGVRPNPHTDSPGVRAAKRAELGLGPDEFVIGSIAVLSEQKGITYLLGAMRELLQTHPAARLLIVGGGPLEGALREQAQALGLGAAVKFTGWRSDVPELLTALDVWVMASLWEAMPLALLEAMSARKAIVVTDVGDNARFVGNGECAVVVPPRDSQALARALAGLISDPGRIPQLGARALRRYQDRYTVGHMVAAHEGLYSQLARG